MTTTYPNRATPVSRQVDYVPAAPLSTVSPPYLMAGCVSLGALILYILTLAPTTQFWDTSEYITAAYTLGIPHPPGNPLFVLIAHVFGLLDRKSTRLNSSHLVISYAVFCLKKK